MIEMTADKISAVETVGLPHGYTVTFYLTTDGQVGVDPPPLDGVGERTDIRVRLAILRAGHEFRAKHTGAPNRGRLH